MQLSQQRGLGWAVQAGPVLVFSSLKTEAGAAPHGGTGGAVGWGRWRRHHRACQDEQRLARHQGEGRRGPFRRASCVCEGPAELRAGAPGRQEQRGGGTRRETQLGLVLEGRCAVPGSLDLVRGRLLEGLGQRTIVSLPSAAQSGPLSALRNQRRDLGHGPGRGDQGLSWHGYGPPGRAWRRGIGPGRIAGMVQEKGLRPARAPANAGRLEGPSLGGKGLRAAALTGSAGHSGTPALCVNPSRSR